MPIVKTVNHMGRFLPPLIYRDGRIILGSGNATKGKKTMRLKNISFCELHSVHILQMVEVLKMLFVPHLLEKLENV